MILPVHALLRQRLGDVLTSLYGLPRDAQPTLAIEVPPTAGARRPRAAVRLRAGTLASQGATHDRAGGRRRGRAPRGCHAHGRRPERLPERVPRSCPIPPGTPRQRPGANRAAQRAAAREDHRRAHGDQPEQGRPHRPPSQLGHGRHARAPAALQRCARRGAELHRRHGRAGGRRRRGLPAHRAAVARAGAGAGGVDALRLLLLGPVCAGHRMVRGRHVAPRHSRSDAARDRARRGRRRRHGRVRGRAHRPVPPQDDGAPQHRLRPADLGGRHPPAAVLGHGLRDPQAEQQHLPAGGRPPDRLLGHEDRR